ncbi:hypothetical protein [Burkholderia multivorans]|uniref:hypothetical protein n=1 Tax=Burkholderia multivorans TaxID=87883 RepID=UPI0021C05269|nr:hypothetical protein [Burkholderia multivorans]
MPNNKVLTDEQIIDYWMQANGARPNGIYGRMVIDFARVLLADHPGQPEPRECRHCGWMCIPNSTPSKTWYPLPQPEPRAEVTDEQIADMFERVTGYSIENGRAALNEADILGFARELLEAARAGEAS